MPGIARARRPPRSEVLSLALLARAKDEEPAQPTPFRVLVRHFLERFFNNEMVSAEGDAKTRLVQAACVLGLPGLVVALYLYTPYHMARQVRPYWPRAADHYFYVLYAMVAMGLVTIFEWDLLFPDLLDVLVLSLLPIRNGRTFAARVTAISLLLGATLLDSGFMALLVLPAATDPVSLPRFLAAHIVAVAMSGTFGAAFFLALEGCLLALYGDRFFRRVSLGLQGIAVIALLSLLFLYPVTFGALPRIVQARSPIASWCPSFWFLGVYQRILGGPSTLPAFTRLAHIGIGATAGAVFLAVASYPLAWWRRTCGLVEGAVRRNKLSPLAQPLRPLVHSLLVRTPAGRAIWHFIGQNLLRVPRYRMILVMAAGMGAALVLATVVRVRVSHAAFAFLIAPAGLRATVPIVAFWTVSGLRTTFLAPADPRGRWIFRAVAGKTGWNHVRAAQRWVECWSALLTMAAVAGARLIAPAAFHGWRVMLAQLLVAVGLSVLLTDAFFLNVATVPFTGSKSNAGTNLALLLIPYLGFFPALVLFTVGAEPWIEASASHLILTAAAAAALHLVLRWKYRVVVAEHEQAVTSDDDEEEFPLRLGLRY